MKKNLEEKKKVLEEVVNSKLRELQDLDKYKEKLTNEIVKISGKLELITELMQEEQQNVEKNKK